MTTFKGLNALLTTKTVGKGKALMAARKERKGERAREYVAALVAGEVPTIHRKGGEKFRAVKMASPQRTLELLSKALNAGATSDDIRHAQQAELARVGEDHYTFVAGRFEWRLAAAEILAAFADEHRAAAATVLGLDEAPSDAAVEEAVTSEAVEEAAVVADAIGEQAWRPQEVAFVNRRGKEQRRIFENQSEFARWVAKMNEDGREFHVRDADASVAA